MRIILNYLIISVVSIILTSNIFCQTSEGVVTMNTTSRLTSQYADEVVAEFGNYKITLGEFEKAYAKNTGGVENAKEDSLEQYKDFLNLYLNYRMKLRDAFVRDYRNDEDLVAELEDYKLKVGAAYLIEKEIIEPGIKNFYDEKSEEVRVSHLMIRVDSSKEAAREKTQKLLDRINKGEPFEKLVTEYSQDKFSNRTGGDIYWFTAGQVLPSFEVAAYNTEVGKIYPEIVETKYGFHIIKVTDRQKRRYKIRASHILIKMVNEGGEMDSNYARRKITKIYNEILNGGSFEELAKEYSDDKGSGAKGGDLGFFERRMMVKPFDETAFKLKVGEMSGIVKSGFGFHIIKVTDELPYPSFEDEKDNLRETYKKSRYQFDYDNFIAKLRKEFNYSLNEKIYEQILSAQPSIKVDDNYKSNEIIGQLINAPIFNYSSKNVSVDSLFAFMLRDAKYTGKELNKETLGEAINKYSSEILINEKSLLLDQSDKEFAQLMNDYQKGVFIFKIQEEEVWDKISVDSIALKKLYEETKESYRWTDRVEFSEIFSRKDSLIKKYYEDILQGADFDSLARRYTQRGGFKAKSGYHGTIDPNTSALAKIAFSLENSGDISEPFKFENGWSIIKLISKDYSRVKTYQEATAELSSNYQESESKRLEDNYLNGLNNLYHPQYYYEELRNAYKTENN